MGAQTRCGSVLRTFGFITYGVVVLIFALLPFTFRLPTSESVTRLDVAMFSEAGRSDEHLVSLPHRWRSEISEARRARYRLRFDLMKLPDESLYLYLPNVTRTAQAWLNGAHVYDSEARRTWAGSLLQISGLATLPVSSLRVGRNELMLELRTAGPLAGRLSALYLGKQEDLAPLYKRRHWINEQLLAMSYAVQVVLTLGLLIGYSNRRSEVSFLWLALTVGLSATFGAAVLGNVLPSVRDLYPHVFLLGPSIGGSSLLFAQALVRAPQWSALKWVVATSPVVLYVSTLTGWVTVEQLSVLVGGPALVLGALATSAVLFWGAWRQRSPEAKWIFGPWSLITIYTMYDSALIVGIWDGSSFVNPGGRLLFTTVIVMVMMKKLSSSLSAVESSEEVLHHRLVEQKAQLGAAHAEQTETVEREAVDRERQRLISDLHDGLGSHLTSILALSERPRPASADIHNVAREALNDLRMVLFSLDSDGSDLSYVLAVYRQHVAALLSNLGIAFEWSMAQLPDISGMTPSEVLTLLRILQEAVTNAQKHGDPKRISIRGLAGNQRMAMLVVENHGGIPFELGAQRGYGLSNMHKRMESLGGSMRIERLPGGARLALQIPINRLATNHV